MTSQGQFHLACKLVQELHGDNKHLTNVLLENTHELIKSTINNLEIVIYVLHVAQKGTGNNECIHILTQTMIQLKNTMEPPKDDN